MTKKIEKLPEQIPVFPLSNFIIFPETTTPLNIFEPRYIQMVDDAMNEFDPVASDSADLKEKIELALDSKTTKREIEDGDL